MKYCAILRVSYRLTRYTVFSFHVSQTFNVLEVSAVVLQQAVLPLFLQSTSAGVHITLNVSRGETAALISE